MNVHRPQRAASGSLTGAVVGLVAGFAIEAVVWLAVFSIAMSNRSVIRVPLVVTTDIEHGAVVATSGLGILVLPVVLAVLGAVVGTWAARRGRRASSSRTAPERAGR